MYVRVRRFCERLKLGGEESVGGHRHFSLLFSPHPLSHFISRMAETLDYEDCLSAAVAAAKLAGDEIRAAWDKERTVEYKGECDLVTATDKKCEDLIFELLQAKFPAHSFVGEESVAAVGAGACTLAVEAPDDDSQYSRVRVTTLTPGSGGNPSRACGRKQQLMTSQYGPRTRNVTNRV